MSRKTNWQLALIIVCVTSVFGHAENSESDITVMGPQQWGDETEVIGISRLFLSGQPDQKALEIARDRGVDVVISLRDPSEIDWDEQAAVTNLRLAFYQVPVDGKAPIWDGDAMVMISEIVAANEDSQILIHCSSGNRASAWLAYHLVVDHGESTDAAISLARQTGLTKASLEQKIRDYLTTIDQGQATP